MKEKSKMIIAVIAVVMMLGCALLPFSYNAEKAVAETEAQDEGYSAFSFEDLIEKIREGASELNFGKVRLIPIGMDGNASMPLPGTIRTTITIADGETRTLHEGTTEFWDDGKIHIASGGTLALFPVDIGSIMSGLNITYELHNENPMNITIIEAEKGAKVSLFGISMVVDFTTETTTMPLLQLYNTDKPAGAEFTATGSKCTAKVSLDTSSSPYKLKATFNVDEASARFKYSVAKFFDTVPFMHNDEKGSAKGVPADHDDLTLMMNITVSGLFTTLNVTGFLLIDVIIAPGILVQGHAKIENIDISMNKFIPEKITGKVSAIDLAVMVMNQEKTGRVPFITIEHGSIDNTGVNINVSEQGSKYSITSDEIVINHGTITINTSLLPTAKLTNKIVISEATETLSGFNLTAVVSNSAAIESMELGGTYNYSVKGISIDFRTSKEMVVRNVTISDLLMEVKGMSIKVNSDATATIRIEKITDGIGSAECTLTVKDVERKITLANFGNVMEEYVANLTKVDTDSPEGKVTIKSVTYSATIPKQKFLDDYVLRYDVTFTENITNLEMTMTGDNTTVKCDAHIGVGMYYNGANREFAVDMQGMTAIPNVTDKNTDVTIKSIVMKNELSIEPLRETTPTTDFGKKVALFKQIMQKAGIGNGQFTFKASDVSFKFTMSEEVNNLKVNTTELWVKNGEGFKEFYKKNSNNVEIEVLRNETTTETGVDYELKITTKSDSVDGYIKSYKGQKESFSISNSPTTVLNYGCSISAEGKLSGGYGELAIQKGNAKFEGGQLPVTVIVEKEASFSANGLTAIGFEFKNGCTKSGTVVLDNTAFSFCTKEKLDLIDPNATISVANGSDYKGFKVLFNLSDINSGTVEMCTGYKFASNAEWTSADGTCKITDIDSDLKKGKLTVTPKENKAYLDLKCDRFEFTLTYSDTGDSSSHKYQDEVTLETRTDGAEGKFIGWFDGTSMYRTGNSYYMPARNVTLTPIYVAEKEPTVLEEEGKKIAVLTTESSAVSVKLPVEFNVLRLSTPDGDIEITKESIDAMLNGNDRPNLVFRCCKLDSEVTSEFGFSDVFDFKIGFLNNGKYIEPYSSEDTKIDVSVKVKADSNNLKGFRITYINSDGSMDETIVDKFTKLENGMFKVPFVVNHFSAYAVEPVYEEQKSGDDNTALIIGIVVAIVIILLLIGVYFYWKKTHGNA